MWKLLVTFSLALGAVSVQAEQSSATQYGLTPETGYTTVVSDPDQCTSKQQIRQTEEYGDPRYITKCDGSIIGWVERTVDTKDLVGTSSKFSEYTADSPSAAATDFQIYLGDSATGVPQFISLETCWHTRDSDLARDPSVQASRNADANASKLFDLMVRKAKFKVQLFYNEFILSGKCMGQITEL